jgi:hypothetical protein
LGRFGAREQVVYTLVKECVNPGSIIPCLVVKWHLCLDEEENTRGTLPCPSRLRFVRSVEEGGPEIVARIRLTGTHVGEEWLRKVSNALGYDSFVR